MKDASERNDTRDSVKVKLYDRFEELEAIQQEWDEFVESAGGEIFLTYDWCRIWWKYYGKNRDLRIFIFRKGQDLVGIIPFFLEKIWLGPIFVTAAKLVASDFTLSQFSLPVASDYIVIVMEKLFESLYKDKWDIMHIGPIAGLYDHYEKLTTAVAESLGGLYRLLSAEKQIHTYFLLADSWEAQLAALSRNARKKIKRRCKALTRVLQNEPGHLVSYFATTDNVNELFEGFVDMHQRHWQKVGRPGHFGDWPNAFEFHKEMATAQLAYKRLRLMIGCWGRYCLGYEYAYKFGDKYFALLNSRTDSKKLSNINVGTCLFTEQVKKAINENIRYMDDMPGRYEYKLRLGGKLFPKRDIYIFQKKFSALARVRMFMILSKVLNVCYFKVWYLRIAPRLPIKRRPLWRIWIRCNAFSHWNLFR